MGGESVGEGLFGLMGRGVKGASIHLFLPVYFPFPFVLPLPVSLSLSLVTSFARGNTIRARRYRDAFVHVFFFLL